MFPFLGIAYAFGAIQGILQGVVLAHIAKTQQAACEQAYADAYCAALEKHQEVQELERVYGLE